MLSCERCGWSFNSARLAREGSCPRCRLRDGVRAPLRPDASRRGFLELIAEAAEQARGERAQGPQA